MRRKPMKDLKRTRSKGVAQARRNPAALKGFSKTAERDMTSAIRNRLAGEILGVFAQAATRFGADPGAGVLTLLQRFPATAAYARALLEDADILSRVHTRWRTSDGYFDSDGHPRVIPISGPKLSYEALCRDCGIRRTDQRERLLKLALALKMATRRARGRIGYLSEISLFTANPTLMFARVAVNMERFLGTSAYNAKPGRSLKESLADRTTQVLLSKKEFRHFANETRSRLHDFIESTDRRLLATASKHPGRKGSRHYRLSGITAFVFRD